VWPLERTGKLERGGLPPFRGFARSFRNFAKSSLQDAEVLSSLFYWKTSFRTTCDTTWTGKEKSEKTEESGSLLRAIFYVFVRYLVKPLHCDYAVHVVVSTGYCIRVYVRKD